MACRRRRILLLLISAFTTTLIIVLGLIRVLNSCQNNEDIVDHLRHLMYPDCSFENSTWPQMLVLMTSHASHISLRSSIRRSLSSSILKERGIIRRFVLAKSETEMEQLRQEQREHGDIVMGDFEEKYRNLVYKHVLGLHWASQTCSQSLGFVLKMDDDISVDLFRLQSLLASSPVDPHSDSTLLGYKQLGLRVQRHPSSKWYVSRKEHEADVYPDFLSGWAYVLTAKALHKLATAATVASKHFLWVDDVWITGILAKENDIGLRALNSFYTVYVEHMQCCVQAQHCDYIVGPNERNLALVEALNKLVISCKDEKCEKKKGIKCEEVSNPLFLPETKAVSEVIDVG